MKSACLGAFLMLLLIACNNAPQRLSGKKEQLLVRYVNFACDCPPYTRVSTEEILQDTAYFYLEPADTAHVIPAGYEDSLYFDYNLVLEGEFYEDQGVPASYIPKTDARQELGRVFRYTRWELKHK